MLLDLVLPGLNRTEVACRLRSDPETAHIRILATTAFWLGERPTFFASAGFDGALRKPFAITTLSEELSSVLSCTSQVRTAER